MGSEVEGNGKQQRKKDLNGKKWEVMGRQWKAMGGNRKKWKPIRGSRKDTEESWKVEDTDLAIGKQWEAMETSGR